MNALFYFLTDFNKKWVTFGMTEPDQDETTDVTVPPLRTLRFDTPSDLYREVTEIGGFTKHRPMEEEDTLQYLTRLRGSTTPEDAVTYTAFAVQPKAAVMWGIESVRVTQPEVAPADRQLLQWIADWTRYPDNSNRWKVLQVALFAPKRTPIVYLGLAVGWSGGPIAPNDPSRMPSWRAPSAVNTAVLSSISTSGPAQRSANLARVLDLASGMFRVYQS